MAALAGGRINASDAVCWGVINDFLKRGKRPTNQMIMVEMGRSGPSVSAYVKALRAAGLIERRLGQGPSTFDVRPWLQGLPAQARGMPSRR